MDSTQAAFICGAMFGLAIGVACEAIAGACERRRQRDAADRAIADAYGDGWSQGRLSIRTVTLGPEVETAECPTDAN